MKSEMAQTNDGQVPMNNQSPSVWSNEDWKREFTDIFFARRGTIFLTALLVFGAALLITFFWPPTYEAAASILVRNKKPPVNPALLEEAEVRTPSISEEDVTSELHILESSELIRRMLINLYATRDDATVKDVVENIPFIEEKKPGAAVNYISGHLETQREPTSNVIRVTYSDKDPDRAEKILNTLLSEYLAYRSLVFSPTAEAAFLTGRAGYYEQQLNAKEAEIIELAKEGNVALIQKEMDNNSDLKMDLSKQLANSRVEYQRKWKTLEPLEKAVREDGEVQMFAFLENESMNRLAEQLATLIQEREDAARHFLPTTSKIQSLDEQIARTYARLRNEARHILANLQNEVESLALTVDQLEQAVQKLADRNVELQEGLNAKRRLEREIALLEHSYETYARRSEEARISSAIAEASLSADVTILSNAEFSAEKIFPDTLLTPLVGLIAGIILGCTLAFVMEYLDHTLKRPSEVERQVGLPVICSIRKV